MFVMATADSARAQVVSWSNAECSELNAWNSFASHQQVDSAVFDNNLNTAGEAACLAAGLVGFLNLYYADVWAPDDRFRLKGPEPRDPSERVDRLYCATLRMAALVFWDDQPPPVAVSVGTPFLDQNARSSRISMLLSSQPNVRALCLAQYLSQVQRSLIYSEITGVTSTDSESSIANTRETDETRAVVIYHMLRKDGSSNPGESVVAIARPSEPKPNPVRRRDRCSAVISAMGSDIALIMGTTGFSYDPDYRRPEIQRALERTPFCFGEKRFRDGGRDWILQYVVRADFPNGPRWVLPHDSEDAALDGALYALAQYGGAFVAVEAREQRKNSGQDPNRAFGPTARDADTCRQMDQPHRILPRLIDEFYAGSQGRWPYLALHTNSNGYSGNGGSGTISISRPSRVLQAHPSPQASGRLRDEDNLVLTAGLGQLRSGSRQSGAIAALNAAGVHAIYEVVTPGGNDCSLSNYLLLTKGDIEYYNIEGQDGDVVGISAMIDALVQEVLSR